MVRVVSIGHGLPLGLESGLAGRHRDSGAITSPCFGLPAWTACPDLSQHANCACYAATSNDPWGPTGTDMSEIAAMTFGR